MKKYVLYIYVKKKKKISIYLAKPLSEMIL